MKKTAREPGDLLFYTNFPITIEIQKTKEICVIDKPEDLPSGEPFAVVKTKTKGQAK